MWGNTGAEIYVSGSGNPLMGVLGIWKLAVPTTSWPRQAWIYLWPGLLVYWEPEGWRDSGNSYWNKFSPFLLDSPTLCPSSLMSIQFLILESGILQNKCSEPRLPGVQIPASLLRRASCLTSPGASFPHLCRGMMTLTLEKCWELGIVQRTEGA